MEENTTKKRSIQETAMHYRQIVILIVTCLVVLGVYGLAHINKNEFPSFTVRQGLVVAVYPGVTAQEMEEQVTKPLEKYIFTYKEVKKEKTTSNTTDGMTVIQVELNDDLTDKDGFWSKFKHGVQGFKSELPQGVMAIQVNDDFGDTAAMLLAMESDDKTYRELHDYMNTLIDSLRLVPSVGKMTVYGQQKDQIAIYVNTQRLSQYNISFMSVAQALTGKGYVTTAGRKKQDGYKQPIYVEHSMNKIYDIENTIIYSNPQGDVVRVKDVAEVKREYPEKSSYITNNGKKCILLSVEIKSGQDVSSMGTAVNEKLDHVLAELPQDVKVSKITDQKKVVDDSIVSFLEELLIAISTVILVVILIMPLRVALVAAGTMPITIFISLGLFYMFGMELNTVTLAALIVTLGMIVDDSIVIIDSYMEMMAEGKSRWRASVDSTIHFFKSIFTATLCISITFFPFLITMTGMTYDFVLFFPWAIFIILFVSMIIAQLFLPILQFFFITKPIQEARPKDGKKPFNLMDLMQKGYDWLLERCFRHPWLTIGVGVASVVVGGLMFTTLPQQLMPNAERNQFSVEIYMPTGTSVTRTAEVSDSLEKLMAQDERIVSIASFKGMASPRFHTAYAPQFADENFAQFVINTTGNKATEELVREFKEKYSGAVPDAVVRIKQLSFSSEANPIEVRIQGNDLGRMAAVSDTVVRILRQMPQLSLVRSNLKEPLATTRITLDDDKASRLGITNQDVEMMMALRYGDGYSVSTAWENDYDVDVVVKSDKADRASIQDIMDEPFQLMMGGSAPLRQFASIEPSWQYGQICHRNGLRTITVMSDVVHGENVGMLTAEVMDRLKDLSLPEGVTISYGGQYEGDGEQTPNIVGALIISIAIIFFVLLWHFKKISEALLVLCCLTLCVFGAAIGIKIQGVDMGLTCVLGFISLMGILVRNGVILFDYAAEVKELEHLKTKDAIHVAAQRRMRPIFLTSAAASMGVVPMILGGSSLWAPMGAVICYGTLITMLFILTVMPVAYWKVMGGQSVRKAKNLALEEL